MGVLPAQKQEPMLPARRRRHARQTQRRKAMLPAQRERRALPAQRQELVLPTQRRRHARPAQRYKAMLPTQRGRCALPAQRQEPMLPTHRQEPMLPAQRERHALSTQRHPTMHMGPKDIGDDVGALVCCDQWCPKTLTLSQSSVTACMTNSPQSLLRRTKIQQTQKMAIEPCAGCNASRGLCMLEAGAYAPASRHCKSLQAVFASSTGRTLASALDGRQAWEHTSVEKNGAGSWIAVAVVARIKCKILARAG